MSLHEKIDEACWLLDTGKLNESREIFLEVLQEDPDNYLAINKMGVIFAREGKLPEAEERFRECLDINPDYAPTWVNMGNIQRQNGNEERAIEFYNIAIEKDSEYHLAYYNLAAACKSRRDYDGYYRNLKKYKRMYKRYVNNKEANEASKVSKNRIYIAAFIIIVITIGLLLLNNLIK